MSSPMRTCAISSKNAVHKRCRASCPCEWIPHTSATCTQTDAPSHTHTLIPFRVTHSQQSFRLVPRVCTLIHLRQHTHARTRQWELIRESVCERASRHCRVFCFFRNHSLGLVSRVYALRLHTIDATSEIVAEIACNRELRSNFTIIFVKVFA